MNTRLIENGNFIDNIASDIYWRSTEFTDLEKYKLAVQPFINKQQAKKNLLDFSNILDNYGVKHLLSYGTLLGAYREHDFIEHDLDTDLIYFDLQGLLDALISKEFKDSGFSVGRVQNIELISVHRAGEFIDLYLFQPLQDGTHGMKVPHWSHVKIADDFLFPNSFIEFLDKRFRTVGKIEEHLADFYGDDWRVPKPAHG